jgi:hypothetical protein
MPIYLRLKFNMEEGQTLQAGGGVARGVWRVLARRATRTGMYSYHRDDD